MKSGLGLWLCILAASVVLMGCVAPIEHNIPPAERLLAPGPGVDGPGPGVMPPMMAMGAGPGGPARRPSVQVLFHRPEGMQVRWDVQGPAAFDSVPLVVPGRQNFPQAAIYRLKVTNIPGREGLELYPTLEIGPTTPRTEAYLAHNAIPIQFTEEDFDQVQAGNFVKKVIYLPDPEFQELALAGVETLVSTRLDPGMDPIVEADRRGAILSVVRLGNKDVELPGTNGDGAGALALANSSPHASGPPAGMFGNHVAGVTSPEWGMPISGTPIGLPGPPHIPLGGPAGLRQHVIRNHTHHQIPEPTSRMRIDVRQQPGFSYPQPPNRLHLTEQSIHPTVPAYPSRAHSHETVY